jgi:UDP-N-acetylmuramate dehydrogenase
LVTPRTAEGIAETYRWSSEEGIPLLVLGKGSNVVISDEGWPGLVLCLGDHWNGIEMERDPRTGEGLMAIQAGALLHSAVTQAVRAGFGGIQELAGIPGTLGGAIVMNAGAYTQEIGIVVEEVEWCEPDGSRHRCNREECAFAYRHSSFHDKERLITQVRLRLPPGDPAQLQAQVTERLRQRKAKQPLHLPNAGSMYKRPPGDYAGRLIETAGLKGFRIGDAAISDLHANFVVNLGNATSQQIFDLSEEVILRVADHSGVRLQKEQIFLGNFRPWPR